MASLKIVVTQSQSANTMVQQYQRPTSSKFADIQAIAQMFEKLNSGGLFKSGSSAPNAVVSVVENEVAATGTLTLTSVVATNTFSINGVTFTGVASGATGNQFNIGASDTLTAANMVTAINASATALVNTQVTASSATNVVTITALNKGYAGNAVTIASGGGTIVASGARLTGGTPDPNQKTYSF